MQVAIVIETNPESTKLVDWTVAGPSVNEVNDFIDSIEEHLLAAANLPIDPDSKVSKIFTIDDGDLLQGEEAVKAQAYKDALGSLDEDPEETKHWVLQSVTIEMRSDMTQVPGYSNVAAAQL